MEGAGGKTRNQESLTHSRHCHGEFALPCYEGRQLGAKIFPFPLCVPRSSSCFFLIDITDIQLSLLQLPAILVRHGCSLSLLCLLPSLSRKRRSPVVVSALGLMSTLPSFSPH